MSAVKYIGRATDFKGRTLWEIVGNLRNFGVGRLVVRNMFQRYPEPCYMRILKVQAVPAEKDEIRKVRVTVEKTWRGVTYPKPVEIFSTSYKPDYQLVPRDEEANYLKNTKKIEERIMPPQIDFPPLLREFVSEETGVKEPMMKTHFKHTHNKFVRLATESEKPTMEISMGLGKPISPNLYEGLL